MPKCSECGRQTPKIFVFLEKAKRVYASLYCKDCAKRAIQNSPITAILTGETIQIVEWKKDHWQDEQGNIIQEG